MKQLFLLLLFILSSNTFASFDNCRMRAIDSDPPRYINVCNTPEGQMRLEDYYRYLDNGLRITSNFEVIDESSFLPESEYPSRAVAIDSARLSETIRRVSELGRVSDTEEMIRARENSNRIDRINERIREINAARERLIQDRDAVIEEQEHMFRLLAQLKNPNPIVRVGTASLMRAQSSKKEFAGEFGQRHLALKNKFKAVRVEDIKSYKLVGSAGMSFLRSEEEFEDGDKSFASDLLSISESLLDVGLGIAPGSSLVKDSYELIFGTNMVTGEELSELERGIALVGVGVGVVSFGSAGGVATTLLRSKKLVKLADHFWNVSAKFLKTSKDVFDKALDVGENVVEGAWKLGLKAKEQASGFAQFSKRVLGNEVGSVGKIDNIIDSAKTGAVKIDDVIVSTPNKLDDLKKVVDNPLDGTQYTSKVREQVANGTDWHHAFPESVDGFAGIGKKTKFTGGDGVVRTRIELNGNYRGTDGYFEWIVEPNKQVNHRKFIPKD